MAVAVLLWFAVLWMVMKVGFRRLEPRRGLVLEGMMRTLIFTSFAILETERGTTGVPTERNCTGAGVRNREPPVWQAVIVSNAATAVAQRAERKVRRMSVF